VCQLDEVVGQHVARPVDEAGLVVAEGVEHCESLVRTDGALLEASGSSRHQAPWAVNVKTAQESSRPRPSQPSVYL
jgi:hypothetical protein